MHLTILQKHSNDGIVKAGELIEIRQTAALTLHDRRVLNVLIENAGPGIVEDHDHHIAMWRLRGETHKGGERVKDSILRLMGTIVEVPVKDRNGNRATKHMTLLSDTTTTDDEGNPTGEVTYSFSKGMREILQQSQHWGRIKAYVMFAFTSKYSLALYEMLCLRGNLRRNCEVFTVEELRGALGVEDGKLMGFPQLNQKAIKPAVEEINALSDFTVEIEALRDGGMQRGKLKGFRVSWERKEQEEWRATMDELMRPKVGRKARIRGKVETLHVI
jgi:hypothetical protein